MRPKKIIGIIVNIILIIGAVILLFYKPLTFCWVMFLYFQFYLRAKYVIKKRGGGM